MLSPGDHKVQKPLPLHLLPNVGLWPQSTDSQCVNFNQDSMMAAMRNIILIGTETIWGSSGMLNHFVSFFCHTLVALLYIRIPIFQCPLSHPRPPCAAIWSPRQAQSSHHLHHILLNSPLAKLYLAACMSGIFTTAPSMPYIGKNRHMEWMMIYLNTWCTLILQTSFWQHVRNFVSYVVYQCPIYQINHSNL